MVSSSYITEPILCADTGHDPIGHKCPHCGHFLLARPRGHCLSTSPVIGTAKSMATIRVRMFATVREAAGVSETELDASTLSELLESLRTRFGKGMAAALGAKGSEGDRVVVLVNGRNTGAVPMDEVPLRDGDDVAVFPPVSGG